MNLNLNQKQANQIAKGILFICGGGIIVMIAMIALIVWTSEPTPEPQIAESWTDQNCLLAIVPVGAPLSISENIPGATSYTLVINSEGQVAIWHNEPCE